MGLTLGVLLPTSRMFPGVDRSFLDGLRGALSGADLAGELAIEPVGNCAVRDTLAEKVQKLLLQRDLAAVTGVVGAGVVPGLRAYFEGARVPLLMNDLGADVTPLGGSRPAYLFQNTLGLWQSCYALGFWASRQLGRTACVCSGFHEAGYGVVQAFWHGFEDAGGGRIESTAVTHLASAVEDPTPAIAQLLEHDPEVIFAAYSGREGVSFTKSLAELCGDAMPNVVHTPLMTHGAWLGEMAEWVDGFHTAFSWKVHAGGETASEFARVASQDPRRRPDVFALLGYETGRLLASAVESVGDENLSSERLHEALHGTSFASPRGVMTMDATTRSVETSDVLLRADAARDVASMSVPMEDLTLPSRCVDDRAALEALPEKSGWLNPYLVN